MKSRSSSLGSAATNCCRYDFKNKQVGVIGGGSSSIQIVPKLQKIEGVKMSVFVRSRTWIASPFGDGKSSQSLFQA
jgi:cation diffusion facilitator CzcD-associated flavoprotein CzcO